MSIRQASESKFRYKTWFKTGLPQLDVAVGSGLPFGRIVEIAGNKSSGKTTLGISLIKSAQAQDVPCLLVDTERKADYEYSEKMGVNLENLLISEAEVGEEFVDDILEVLDKGKVKVLIIDSVDGIVPRAILEATADQQTMGAQARLIAKLIRKSIVPVQKHKICMILLNQYRVDFLTGQMKTTGGKAVEYYASVQIKLKQSGRIMKGEQVVGIQIEGEVLKNQVGVPYEKFQTNIIFGEGMGGAADLAEVALKAGVITRKGNSYYLGEEKLGVGLAKVRDMITNDVSFAAKLKSLL